MICFVAVFPGTTGKLRTEATLFLMQRELFGDTPGWAGPNPSSPAPRTVRLRFGQALEKNEVLHVEMLYILQTS